MSDELIVKLLAEGCDLQVLSRASGISVDDLASLGITDQSQALPEAAIDLAWLAIDEGKKILRTGTQANRVRLVSTIFTHVMRSYRGESPKAFQQLGDRIARILAGEDLEVEEDEL